MLKREVPQHIRPRLTIDDLLHVIAVSFSLSALCYFAVEFI